MTVESQEDNVPFLQNPDNTKKAAIAAGALAATTLWQLSRGNAIGSVIAGMATGAMAERALKLYLTHELDRPVLDPSVRLRSLVGAVGLAVLRGAAKHAAELAEDARSASLRGMQRMLNPGS